MSTLGSPEKVYVELEWYDGPRVGIADINGVPHRFISRYDESDDAYLEIFQVFPIDAETLSLELEQWKIFVAWNAQYESGAVPSDTHPGVGGINPRWDELENLLRPSRVHIPSNVRTAHAQLHRLDREQRYADDGPDYRLSWCLL